MPQVGFKNDGDTDWKWVSESALTDSIVDPYRKSAALIEIIGPSQADIDRLTAKLNTLGINFNCKGPLPQPTGEDGTMLTKLASKVEDRILRAIGKIPGNYVAYIHGAAFFLRPDFDDCRNWVRDGTPPPWRIPPGRRGYRTCSRFRLAAVAADGRAPCHVLIGTGRATVCSRRSASLTT